MSEKESPIHFDQNRADTYDERMKRMGPIMEALHLLIGLSFSELPKNARILCVGVGTGAELIGLAQANPEWTFVAVEPAPAMLAKCRQKAEALGFASRCTFHEGYLDSLEDSGSFDAATCILVSHFILKREERVAFFAEIASRLKSGGLLVSADISSDMQSEEFQSLLPIWCKALSHSGHDPETVKSYIAALGTGASVLPPAEVAAIIKDGGFSQATLFYQSLLIHGWLSKRD